MCIQIFVVGVGFGCLSGADSTQSNKMRDKREKKYISLTLTLSSSDKRRKNIVKKLSSKFHLIFLLYEKNVKDIYDIKHSGSQILQFHLQLKIENSSVKKLI